jgi:hypothetical protein
MIRVPFEHLIGSRERIDVPRSCAFVIPAITLVWRVTTSTGSRRIPLLARLFTNCRPDEQSLSRGHHLRMRQILQHTNSAIDICSKVTEHV